MGNEKLRDYQSTEQEPPFRGHHPLQSRDSADVWVLQVIQEDEAMVQYSGRNPESPRFTPYLSLTAVLQGLRLRPAPRKKPPSAACPSQGQVGRLTDGMSPAGFGEQLCTEAPPTGEERDMMGCGDPGPVP